MQILRPEEASTAIGREMTSDEVAAMTDEQKVQLLKIREETMGPAKVGQFK